MTLTAKIAKLVKNRALYAGWLQDVDAQLADIRGALDGTGTPTPKTGLRTVRAKRGEKIATIRRAIASLGARSFKASDVATAAGCPGDHYVSIALSDMCKRGEIGRVGVGTYINMSLTHRPNGSTGQTATQ